MKRFIKPNWKKSNLNISATLAEFLGKSEQTICNKINENGTEFNQSEIAKIAKRYQLTAEQVVAIFFA